MTLLEGALKYFLLGAFASGFLLYGIALMYSATGTTKIPVVYMYMLPASGEIPVPRPPRTAFSLALCASAAVVMVPGVVPRSVLEFAERSVLSLLM